MSEFTPLPWFAFNIEKWMADTKRLNTEGQGAYLALCLEIYQKGDPLPDDNEMLAAIAGLDQQAWNKQRKFLAPFFVIGNGLWRHSRCEREMKEAAALMAERKARSEHANLVAAAKRAATGTVPVTVPETAKRTPKSRKGTEAVTDTVRAEAAKKGADTTTEAAKKAMTIGVMVTPQGAIPVSAEVFAPPPVEASSGEPHKQETSNLLEREKEPSPPEELAGLQGKEEGGFVTVAQAGGMAPIPIGWTPSEANIEVAHDHGMTDAEVDDEARTFVNNALSKDLMSANWDSSWSNWCRRFRDWKAKQPAKAPPRVEVNTTIDWDRHVGFFARTGVWSKHIGNEPGMTGCKAPAEVLEKHGIDPKTGEKVRGRA